MGINKREEGKKVNSNINVTPMVDVMLVLLIIFMVITPMLNNKVNVELPVANAAIIMDNANKEDAVTVAVTRDGRTYRGGAVVSVALVWRVVAPVHARRSSLLYPPRLTPDCVELAAVMASSTAPTGMITVVGPKISSWAMRIVVFTSPNTVGR